MLDVSVAAYQRSLVVLLLPWSASPAVEDGTRLSATSDEAEDFAAKFRELADWLHLAFLEVREPDLQAREDMLVEAVTEGSFPINNWSLDYYSQTSKRKPYKPDKQDKTDNEKQLEKLKEGLFPHHIPYYLDMKDGEGMRVIEMFEDHIELRVGNNSSSRFVRKHGLEGLLCIKFDQMVRPQEVQRLLVPGVWVGGHLFNFLGCSQNGLKERSALMWKGSKEEVAGLLASCGDFHNISTVSKMMAREGLLFSSVQMSGVYVEKEDIIKGEDIEQGGFCFTDGCGEISQDMLDRVMETLSSSFLPPDYVPSVLQLRLQGMKGVVALNPGLEQGKLLLRPSQNKFDTNFDSCLAVAGISRPYTFAHLNKQFIILLSGLGVPDSVFLTLHEEFFQLVESMLYDKEAAITMMQWKNQWDVAEHLAKMSALNLSTLSSTKSPGEIYRSTEPGVEIMRKLAETQEKILTSDRKKKKDGSVKEKLRILVRESRLIYGVCDQGGQLQYGQCQVLWVSVVNLLISSLGENHN